MHLLFERTEIGHLHAYLLLRNPFLPWAVYNTRGVRIAGDCHVFHFTRYSFTAFNVKRQLLAAISNRFRPKTMH